MPDKNLSEKERELLEIVVEYYIRYGTPVGSKFLDKSEVVKMAPSTIRKYLNLLEKKGLVYQPYNSAGRMPTLEGVNTYLGTLLSTYEFPSKSITRVNKNFNLRHFIEILGEHIDGVAFGFYEDENDIYYLGLAKLLKKVNNDLEKIIPLMEFIENKQIIPYVSKVKIKEKEINYNFVNYQGVNIALMFIKVEFEGIPAIIGTVSSLRVDYKNNIKILQTILEKGTI